MRCISKRARTYERKESLYARECVTQTLCKSIVFHVCRFGGQLKSSIFKTLGNKRLGPLYLKRECGASLNARELTGEKKLDMGENLSPRVGTQMTSTVSISSHCFLFLFLFVFNSLRTGLYSSKAAGVFRKTLSSYKSFRNSSLPFKFMLLADGWALYM